MLPSCSSAVLTDHNSQANKVTSQPGPAPSTPTPNRHHGAGRATTSNDPPALRRTERGMALTDLLSTSHLRVPSVPSLPTSAMASLFMMTPMPTVAHSPPKSAALLSHRITIPCQRSKCRHATQASRPRVSPRALQLFPISTAATIRTTRSTPSELFTMLRHPSLPTTMRTSAHLIETSRLTAI